nr:hypothetical protein [Variovorax boronicumulans]
MARPISFFALGVAALVLLAELVLRLLPVSTATMTGYHHDPDQLTYPPGHHWTMSTGWDLRNAQHLVANNWGFAADHDFGPDARAVALIGDSYVEASMLAPADRPAAQLQAILGDGRPVFALGTPGTALLDYAQRLRLAQDRFGVRDAVLMLERFDARQALCGSGNVVSRCLDPVTLQPRIERLPPPGWLTRVLRHSALAQYLKSQLRFRPAALAEAMFTRATPEPAAARTHGATAPPTAQEAAHTRAMVDAVVENFFSTLAPVSMRHLVFVVDGGRGGAHQHDGLVGLERAHLIARLRERGALVQDMAPVYAAHAARSQRSLAVGPHDDHLNPLGVQLAMQEAAAALRLPASATGD